MYRTINGGISWQELTLRPWPESANALVAVSFSDQNNGAAIGANEYEIETSDGGLSWTVGYAGANYTDIYHAGSEAPYITGEKGTLYRAGEGDLNREIKYDIFAIDFYNQNGIAVGENCVFRYVEELSINGKWSYMLTPDGKSINKTYYDVAFADANAVFAVGENGIITKFRYD